MGNLLKTANKNLLGKEGLTGLGASFLLTLAQYILRKPGVQAYMDSLVDRLFPVAGDRPPPPPGVAESADAIRGLFEGKGIRPCRVAIDGVPGSGKSTLAQALGQRLRMDVVCLDHHDMDIPGNFTRENAIYEHHRLLRTQDIDAFDVLCYLDDPVYESKKKVLERRRGGYLMEFMDYERLKRIGDLAFACAQGEPVSLGRSCIRLKFRPDGGYQDRGRMNADLRRAGFDGSAYSKEEALFLLLEGKPRKGFKAYINLHACDRELCAALTESLLLSGGRRRGR